MAGTGLIRLTRRAWDVLLATYQAWRADRVVRLGAGLAYYGLFALVPLLAITIAIAGMFFEVPQVEQALATRLADILGDEVDTASLVNRASEAIGDGSTQAGFGLIGLVSVVLGGSLFFLAYQDALNVIFHESPRSGIEFSFRRRFHVSLMVLLTGGTVAAVLVLQMVGRLLRALLPGLIDWPGLLNGVAGASLGALLGTFLIAIALRALVYDEVGWRPALIGAAATATCMAVAALGFEEYMARVGSHSLSGAAAGVLLVITFIYVEAQVLLAGGVLTMVINERSAAAPDVIAPAGHAQGVSA